MEIYCGTLLIIQTRVEENELGVESSKRSWLKEPFVVLGVPLVRTPSNSTLMSFIQITESNGSFTIWLVTYNGVNYLLELIDELILLMTHLKYYDGPIVI